MSYVMKNILNGKKKMNFTNLLNHKDIFQKIRRKYSQENFTNPNIKEKRNKDCLKSSNFTCWNLENNKNHKE